MIPKEIGIFKHYNKRPNAIKYGFLYDHLFETTLPQENERMIRVFLPDDYFTHTDKRYGVMYMSDGQNLVDKYLTQYDEWDIDVRNHEMMKNGYDGLIYVGLDSPKDSYVRGAEMFPETLQAKAKYQREGLAACASIYLDYLFDVVKPIIDKTFRTIPDRNHTIFGGSSMGGLIGFYAGFYRQDVISKVLCYSPGFILAPSKVMNRFTIDLIKQYGSNVKIALLSGGTGFEKQFIKPTCHMYLFLLKHGFKPSQLDLLIDSSGIHHESFWSKHFIRSMEFLLNDGNDAN